MYFFKAPLHPLQYLYMALRHCLKSSWDSSFVVDKTDVFCHDGWKQTWIRHTWHKLFAFFSHFKICLNSGCVCCLASLDHVHTAPVDHTHTHMHTYVFGSLASDHAHVTSLNGCTREAETLPSTHALPRKLEVSEDHTAVHILATCSCQLWTQQ